jgi:hypothetical protein
VKGSIQDKFEVIFGMEQMLKYAAMTEFEVNS